MKVGVGIATLLVTAEQKTEARKTSNTSKGGAQVRWCSFKKLFKVYLVNIF